MSIGAIVAIVIAAIIVVAAGTLAVAEMRRRALIQRFGPEYERLASEKGARRAGAELTARQRLLSRLDIRPLTDGERESYARRWNGVQEQFVDDPTHSVNAASSLITAVLKDRGYPTDNGDETMQALSVEHARALQDYRKAQKLTGESAADGNGVSTEDLRQALLGYRRLFRELTGSSDGGVTASTPASGSAPAPAPASGSAPAPAPAPVPAPASALDPAPVPVPFPASVRARMARMSTRSASADNTRAADASADDAAADDAKTDDAAADDAYREADHADREIADTGRETAEKE